MKQSHIREWEENNRLINFKWALTCKKNKRNSRRNAETQVINLKAKLS